MSRSDIRRLAFALTAVVLAVTAASCGVSRQAPVQLADNRPHRLSDDHPLRVAGAQPFGDVVQLDIVIDPDGTVRSARPIGGFEPAFAAARAEVEGWRYEPVLRNRQMVAARFEDRVIVVPADRPIARHVPFPEIRDPSSIRIGFAQHGTCFAPCLTYSVEIAADGIVSFDGEVDTIIAGRHTATVSPGAVSALVDLFRNSDFFSFDDEDFPWMGADLPSSTLWISFDGRTKSFEDRSRPDVPAQIATLQAAVIRTSGADKWILGTDETLDLLRAGGVDLRSSSAAALVAGAMAQHRSDFLRSLLAAGSPLDGPKGMPGSYALVIAASRDDRDATAVAEAAAARGTPDEKSAALVIAARLGDLELLRRLLSGGADPNAGNAEGTRPLDVIYSEDAALQLLAAGARSAPSRRGSTTLRDQAREAGWTRVLAKLGR